MLVRQLMRQSDGVVHLELLGDQVEEFDTELDLTRLRAEGIATLISIRELWLHVPELRSQAWD